MTNKNCQDFADLLIEYSDCELSDSEQRRVEGHLQECSLCRAELALLNKSLGVARTIWKELAETDMAGTGQSPGTHAARLHPIALQPRPIPREVSRRWPWRVSVMAIVAASISIALLGYRLISTNSSDSTKHNAEVAGETDAEDNLIVRSSEGPVKDVNSRPVSADEAPTLAFDEGEEDIDALLASEARAARLAAAAELLASVPSLSRYSRQADEYLVANFADSRAVRTVSKRSFHDETAPEPDDSNE